jgi:hypothetical protein
MNSIARRIALPFVAIVVLWVAVTLVATSSAEALLGIWFAERLTPFGNAHLLEEASEGSYSPITDPAFLLYAVALAAIVFGCASYFAAIGVPRAQRFYASIPSLTALLLLAWLLRYVWSASYPSPMRLAFIFQLGACLVASCTGLLLAWRRNTHGTADGG